MERFKNNISALGKQNRYYTMKVRNLKFSLLFLLVSVVASFVFEGCKSGENEDADKVDATVAKVDSNKANILKINGEIISIPSPIQTAILIKKVSSTYNKEILNKTDKLTSYATNFSKALNLGIYGADLGYITMYEQPQDAITYLNSVKKLADELGVSGAFDPQTVERFQKNIGTKDSLLVLVSEAYRASDAYLKNNERNNLSGLILTGGWIETLYFATNIMKTKNSEDLKRRIGEQKSSLNSLIKLLTPYYSQAEYTPLIDKLTDLATVFEGVEFKYTYEKPVIDVPNKTTNINSKTEVKISPEQVDQISQKIQTIRNLIVG